MASESETFEKWWDDFICATPTPEQNEMSVCDRYIDRLKKCDLHDRAKISMKYIDRYGWRADEWSAEDVVETIGQCYLHMRDQVAICYIRKHQLPRDQWSSADITALLETCYQHTRNEVFETIAYGDPESNLGDKHLDSLYFEARPACAALLDHLEGKKRRRVEKQDEKEKEVLHRVLELSKQEADAAAAKKTTAAAGAAAAVPARIPLKNDSKIKAVKKATRQDEECVICADNAKNILAMPCSHLILCQDCEPTFIARECPICRKQIQEFIVVVM